MEYKIACPCGKVIPVSEEMAGSWANCECGETFLVPWWFEVRAAEITGEPVLVIPQASPLERSEPAPQRATVIINPTEATATTDPGSRPESGRRAQVMAALTADAVWIQDTWQVRSLSLQGLQIERRAKAVELSRNAGSDGKSERLTLAFASAAEGQRWYDKIQACQAKLNPDAPPDTSFIPEGVALVRNAADVPLVPLGRVAFLGRSPGTADRGIQIRAAMLGADAVIALKRKKCPEVGWGARQITGLAARVADLDAQKRLRWIWYAEEVSALTNGMLLLIVIEAALSFVALVFLSGKSHVLSATGETIAESIASAGLGLALLFSWPVILALLLRILRWPGLLLPAGLAVVSATTARGFVMVAALILAVVANGTAYSKRWIWLALDPVDWTFIIIGAVLFVRALRLSREANVILPEEAQVVSAPRKLWSRGLLAATGVYALVCLGWVGVARYQDSVHLVQEGVDPKREHQALLALNEGAAHSHKGDIEAAEASFQRALGLWEELTKSGSAPSIYRINLAVTLNDLGWVRHRQQRFDEAENYYSRAVALADQLVNDPHLDDGTRQTFAESRDVLTRLRDFKSTKMLEERDDEAVRKYEDAQVMSEKEDLKAEQLVRDAIATWEDILPHAASKEYPKFAVGRLATAFMRLAGLQERLGKRPDSEASLKKSIDYGARAVELDPSRPLHKHNLDLANRMLEGLHNDKFQEEINKLNRAARFAAVIDRFKQGIKEQDERVQAGKGLETAVPSLAYRLDRFAWFLAHCPDRTRRDTKSAVDHARRATSLRPDLADYWYTLALVQYRHGDWPGSLASLETLKAKQGEFTGSDLLLSAMNLERLNRREDAQAAVGNAVQWMEEKSRKAGGDALLRMEFELMRSNFEALLHEAQSLLNGVPADSGRPT
jgi:tetratricopeptide (TPR) repeat protein